MGAMRIKRVTFIVFSVLTNLSSALFLAISYIIPIHKYGWANNENISGIVNADAVLVTIYLLLVSIASLIGAFCFFFALKTKNKIKVTVFFELGIIFALDIIRLIQVLPYYSG